MKKIKEEYFYTNDEFYSIINDIITNDEFIKTKYIRHHGITRYNHSLRVAYHTFLVTKKLKLQRSNTSSTLTWLFFGRNKRYESTPSFKKTSGICFKKR